MNPAAAPAAPLQHPSVLREARLLVQLLTGALVCSGYSEHDAAEQANLLLTATAPTTQIGRADH